MIKTLKFKLLALILLISVSGISQKLKIEYISGEVSRTAKDNSAQVQLKKNDVITLTDKLFLGEKALLVVSDATYNLFEVKKKGFITGKELSEGLSKSKDSEYQRYLSYILKEMRSHETEMKNSDKGIPGAPSRGENFEIILPDTLILFDDERIPINWLNSPNTEVVNIQLQSESKSMLLDLEVKGDIFWFNSPGYFLSNHKSLHLYIYENRTDGKKVLRSHCVILRSLYEKTNIQIEFDKEFAVLEDPRLNLLSKATKWEVNHYYLQALELYKILLLDYPEDEMVNALYKGFIERSGFDN
jgi:hypothetical protein